MINNYEIAAKQAVDEVFEIEYSGLLLLPRPKIIFLNASDTNYDTGQYYIEIGSNWQIHLDFGKLSKSINKFKQEVKVLYRHEIEHFNTCPFSVSNHFKMINIIKKRNELVSKENQVNLATIASIANQVADIIIDTKNYFKYPKETFDFEKEWVHKSSAANFSDYARKSKLMFLVKEALWGEDFDINELDKNLLEEVDKLKNVFNEDGITNENLFYAKTEEFTDSFLKLYKLDKEDLNNSSSNIKEFDVLSSSNSYGNEFIFLNSENLEAAIRQLAQNSDLKDFTEILNIAGVSSQSGFAPDKLTKIYFEQQNVDKIPLPAKTSGSLKIYSYPSVWRLSDPISELDIMLSSSSFPKLIPGITTKKWKKHHSNIDSIDKNKSDLLLVIDKSGSMGSISSNSSNLFQAISSAFGFLKYFEEQQSEIALINFSDSSKTTNWTNEYEKIKEDLLIPFGGGTTFPIKEITKLSFDKKSNFIVVVITDGDIQNWNEAFTIFKDILMNNNKLFLFLFADKSKEKKYLDIISYGGFVKAVNTVDDIRNTVFNEII